MNKSKKWTIELLKGCIIGRPYSLWNLWLNFAVFRRTCTTYKRRVFYTFAWSTAITFFLILIPSSFVNETKPTISFSLLTAASLIVAVLAALITLLSICLNFSQTNKEFPGFIGFFIEYNGMSFDIALISGLILAIVFLDVSCYTVKSSFFSYIIIRGLMVIVFWLVCWHIKRTVAIYSLNYQRFFLQLENDMKMRHDSSDQNEQVMIRTDFGLAIKKQYEKICTLIRQNDMSLLKQLLDVQFIFSIKWSEIFIQPLEPLFREYGFQGFRGPIYDMLMPVIKEAVNTNSIEARRYLCRHIQDFFLYSLKENQLTEAKQFLDTLFDAYWLEPRDDKRKYRNIQNSSQFWSGEKLWSRELNYPSDGLGIGTLFSETDWTDNQRILYIQWLKSTLNILSHNISMNNKVEAIEFYENIFSDTDDIVRTSDNKKNLNTILNYIDFSRFAIVGWCAKCICNDFDEDQERPFGKDTAEAILQKCFYESNLPTFEQLLQLVAKQHYGYHNEITESLGLSFWNLSTFKDERRVKAHDVDDSWIENGFYLLLLYNTNIMLYSPRSNLVKEDADFLSALDIEKVIKRLPDIRVGISLKPEKLENRKDELIALFKDMKNAASQKISNEIQNATLSPDLIKEFKDNIRKGFNTAYKSSSLRFLQSLISQSGTDNKEFTQNLSYPKKYLIDSEYRIPVMGTEVFGDSFFKRFLIDEIYSPIERNARLYNDLEIDHNQDIKEIICKTQDVLNEKTDTIIVPRTRGFADSLVSENSIYESHTQYGREFCGTTQIKGITMNVFVWPYTNYEHIVIGNMESLFSKCVDNNWLENLTIEFPLPNMTEYKDKNGDIVLDGKIRFIPPIAVNENINAIKIKILK